MFPTIFQLLSAVHSPLVGLRNCFQRPGVGPKDQIRSDATAVEAAQGRIPDAWD